MIFCSKMETIRIVAAVMELADIQVSKTCERKLMGVRLSPAAPVRKRSIIRKMCRPCKGQDSSSTHRRKILFCVIKVMEKKPKSVRFSQVPSLSLTAVVFSVLFNLSHLTIPAHLRRNQLW